MNECYEFIYRDFRMVYLRFDICFLTEACVTEIFPQHTITIQRRQSPSFHFTHVHRSLTRCLSFPSQHPRDPLPHLLPVPNFIFYSLYTHLPPSHHRTPHKSNYQHIKPPLHPSTQYPSTSFVGSAGCVLFYPRSAFSSFTIFLETKTSSPKVDGMLKNPVPWWR